MGQGYIDDQIPSINFKVSSEQLDFIQGLRITKWKIYEIDGEQLIGTGKFGKRIYLIPVEGK